MHVPRQVDVTQRRNQIASAILRLVGEHGLEAVSLRRVAVEAGVSTGHVQHYFRTKEEMLRFTVDSIEQRVQERFAADMAAQAGAPSPRATIRTLLLQSMPLDEERVQIGRAYLSGGLYQTAVGERIRRGIAELIDAIAGMVTADGRHEDARRISQKLLAVHEGLAVLVISGTVSAADALEILDGQLDEAFGEERHAG